MSNLLRLLNRREFAHPSLAVLSRKGTLPSPLVSSPALISLYLSPHTNICHLGFAIRIYSMSLFGRSVPLYIVWLHQLRFLSSGPSQIRLNLTLFPWQLISAARHPCEKPLFQGAELPRAVAPAHNEHNVGRWTWCLRIKDKLRWFHLVCRSATCAPFSCLPTVRQWQLAGAATPAPTVLTRLSLCFLWDKPDYYWTSNIKISSATPSCGQTTHSGVQCCHPLGAPWNAVIVWTLCWFVNLFLNHRYPKKKKELT